MPSATPLATRNSILNTPPWKIFASFIIGVLASEFIALVTAKYFSWSMDYGPYPTLRYGLITLLMWVYPYFVGRELSRMRGSVTAHRLILWIGLLAVVNNIVSVYYTETFGVAWPVVLVTVLVNVFCLITVLSFPARELKSIELKRKSRFAEHWNELLQFMLWPFCVWWLQRRLTESVNKALR